ncbi:NAD(P)/FAD-dependent oxidoreductase [Halopenitus persicus]|nr:FAD-dependent oxidoreductase [Halopenitus persicus]
MSVVVIGGGIVGVRLARALRDHPADVHLLEKDALGAGTTAKSIAVFSWLESDPSPFAQSLRERAWRTYADRIAEDAISFERIGALLVARTESYRSQLEHAAETYAEHGPDVELLDPADLEAFGIAPEETAGALYTPEEGYLDPGELVSQWAAEAREGGADIRTGVEATGIRTRNGAVTAVETTDGEIAADVVINAAGPWAPRLNRMVGVSAPLRHTKGRILVLETDGDRTLPYTQFESGQYVRGEGRSQVFAGRLEREYADASELDPDEPRSVGGEFYADVADTTARLVPAVADADVAAEWVGLRTVTPDGLPIVGPTAVDGYHLACGLSGLGITYAPVVGDLLAEYVATGDRPPALDRLAPDRFA